MASKGNSGSTVNNVWKLVEPIAESLGLTIWDVRFEKEGAGWYLRIFIDKDGGVSINDCVDMSHAVDKPIDEADPIEQSYCLEVCSPGVERELRRDSHFEQSIGKKIMVKLIRPLNGEREFKGVLNSYDNGNFELCTGEGQRLMINKKEASYVKLDDFGGEEQW